MKELDKNNIILVLEILILMIYFNEFRQTLLESDVIRSSYFCGIRLLEYEEMVNNIENEED